MKVATAAEKQMAELRDAASDEVAIAVEKYEAAAETIRQLQAELVRSADAAEANDAAVQSAREELRASQAEAGVALARTREHAETLAGERAALLQKQGEWGSEREAMQRELEGLDATVKAADERTREANVARAAAEAEAMAAKLNSLQRTPGRKGPSSAHWPLKRSWCCSQDRRGGLTGTHTGPGQS